MQRMRTILFVMLAAAAFNIAIAWAAALKAKPADGAMPTSAHPGGKGTGAEALSWHTRVPPDWPAPSSADTAHGPGLAVHYMGAHLRSAEVVRAGWPFYSLRATRLSKISSGLKPLPLGTIREGIDTRESLQLVTVLKQTVNGRDITSRRTLNLKRKVPLEPIWAGFAANTLLYAAAILLPWWSVRQARTLVRRRRGCCPECGYAASSLTPICPECGHAVAGHAPS